MPIRLWHILVLIMGVSGNALAQDAPQGKALPDPLTLDYALSQARAPHPDIQASQNLIDTMAARREQAEAADDWSTSINGRMRWLNLPGGVGLTDDHALGITLEKPLLDFGVSANRQKSARLYEEGAREKLISTVQSHKEEIMRRYFDVLLNDLQFFRENERMAVSFIRLDRARQRQKLGQADDLQIAKLNADYQKVRRDRYYYEGQQRVTRARLAMAINQPGNLSSNLSVPDLPQLKRKLPSVEDLQALAEKHNPGLLAMHKDVEAAQAALAAARNSDGLTVTAEADYHSYTFQPAAREDWRVGLQFNYPLTRGGRTEANIALALADLHKTQNTLRDARLQLQQAVLETWSNINSLKVEREQMQANNDYQGLSLDKTRLRYEQEMQADLGDSMVLSTDAEWKLRKSQYETALQWSHLEGLVGVPYEQFPKPDNDN